MKKCEAVNINTVGKIRFNNGQVVAETDEAKYLGCLLNENTEAKNKSANELQTPW